MGKSSLPPFQENCSFCAGLSWGFSHPGFHFLPGLGTYSQEPSGFGPILCFHTYGQAEKWITVGRWSLFTPNPLTCNLLWGRGWWETSNLFFSLQGCNLFQCMERVRHSFHWKILSRSHSSHPSLFCYHTQIVCWIAYLIPKNLLCFHTNTVVHICSLGFRCGNLLFLLTYIS